MMNNHDYHMISEDSLRSSSNNHQEFFQNYLSSNPANNNNNNNNNNANTDDNVATRKLELTDTLSVSAPLLGLKQSSAYASYNNESSLIMKYRNIGKNGLRLPLLAFSAWNSFAQNMEDAAEEVLTVAYENGINYFDTGDAFCSGQAEIMLGNILKKKNWRRCSYIVSTKIFWKSGPSTHLGGGLSRKFIIEAVEASLSRLRLKYIDILIIRLERVHSDFYGGGPKTVFFEGLDSGWLKIDILIPRTIFVQKMRLPLLGRDTNRNKAFILTTRKYFG